MATEMSNLANGSEITALAASKLTGALPAISGAALTNLPGGGHTITISQATTTWLWSNPSGYQNKTINLTNYPFYPRVQVNSKGSFTNTVSTFIAPVAGTHRSGKQSDPGYPSTSYNNAIGIRGSFGYDHTRTGWGRVSYQYMTFA